MMTHRRIAGMAILFLIIATATILITMGRPPICTCGTISLWHGAINSSQDSQQLSDWYSFSHIIHGFLFFGGGWLLLRRYSLPVRLALAVALESGWEILENSPIIIDRYRTATIALGYSGDSVLNSMSDIGMMTLGFLFASRAPVKVTILTAIAFELFTLWAIRDNLTLNILMLAKPIDAIRVWQAGA